MLDVWCAQLDNVPCTLQLGLLGVVGVSFIACR